jgi:TolA-binding protein
MLLAGGAGADEVNIGGLPRRGTVTGADEFSVTLRIRGGRQVSSNVSEVRQITIANRSAFNKAEKLYADGEYAKAINAYKQAARQARRDWLERLIRYRKYLALDRSGQINDAVEEWLGLVEEHEKHREVLKAHPTKLAAKGSDDNAKAIRLLEAKLQREKSGAFADAIKQLLLKLYKRQGRTDDAAKLAGKTLTEGNGDEGDQDRDEGEDDNGSTVSATDGNAAKVLRAASVVIEQAADPDAELTAAQRVTKARTALNSLQSRAKGFTTGDLPEALLWMGKAQLAIAENSDDAREELLRAGLNFMRVVTFFAASTDAPEALFLAGKVNQKLGNTAAARNAWQAVKEHFPDTRFAPRASKALEGLSNS